MRIRTAIFLFFDVMNSCLFLFVNFGVFPQHGNSSPARHNTQPVFFFGQFPYLLFTGWLVVLFFEIFHQLCNKMALCYLLFMSFNE